MDVRRPSGPTAGRIMVGIALAGLLVATAGTVVAWRLVGEVEGALDEGLALTAGSLATFEDTVAVADQVVGDVAAGLGELQVALVELERGLGQAQPVLGDVGRLSADVPPALTSFQQTLDEVAGAAAEVDRALAQLDAIPFAPAVPRTDLGDRLATLSDDLDPVVAALEGSSADLEQLAATTADLQAQVGDLGERTAAIAAQLDESAEVVDRYRQQAEQGTELAEASRGDLAGTTRAMRALVLLGGLVFAAGQFVPLWLGLGLLRQDLPEDAAPPDGALTPSAAPGAGATTPG